MKRSDLKELIREEIKKVLSENIGDVKGQLPTEPGRYQIDYIVADEDGGPDYSENNVVNISQDSINMSQDVSPSTFWRGEARSIAGFNIYKVEKVTRV